MKAARVLLVGIGALVVLLIVASILALNSTVQTWAARRALNRQPGVVGTLGRVSANLHHVTVTDLHLKTRDAVLTLPSLAADLPLVSAAFRDQVLIKRLVAKGWTLDLSATAPTTVSAAIAAKGDSAAATHASAGFSFVSSAQAAEATATRSAAAVFRGVVANLRLPVDVSLDGVELEGDVILPASADSAGARTKVVLRGGGLEAGKSGAFTVALNGTQADGSALDLNGSLTAAMDTPRTFTRLGAKANASAKAPQLPNGVTLNIDATADRTVTGENYALLLAAANKQLAAIKAELVNADARITGTWKIDLHDSDLTPFALGRQLPSFAALGDGSFESSTALDKLEVHATGQIKASANHLEILRPELSAVGEVNITADFDVLQHGESLRVEKFSAQLANAAPVASIHALQPFELVQRKAGEFNLLAAELRVADPGQDLVELSMNGLPLAWARPLLGEISITGGDLRGEFAASARNGGLALRAKTPATVTGLSLSKANDPWLKDVDLTFSASADYTLEGWQAQVADFQVRHADVTLLNLNAKAGQLTGKDRSIKATGQWQADLRGWLSQPVVAGKLQLASGLAQGEFSASADGTTALETKLALTNLVATTKEKLPAVSAELRAGVAADGRVTFQAPMIFTQDGRKSDLLLAGDILPAKPVSTITGRLSGDLVVVEDLKLLALLLPPASAPAAPEKPGTPPVWSAVTGQIVLALKKVVYGGTYVVSDVGGTIKLDPGSIKFDGVRAMFGPESDLKLAGGVTFDANAKEAYRINADVALSNFDTAAAFRAINPAKLPTVEGRVNLVGHVAGDGANLGEAAEKARGKFDVSSKGGIFRALSTVLPTEKLQSAQSALSVVGGFLGGSTAESVSSINEIVKIISEIQFDQLSLTAERGKDLNLVLQDFTLISPNIRLGGAGQVFYQPGTSVLQQPLDLRITLGARGRLGELLSQVKMLKAEKDSLGYTALSAPITLGGTIAQTDTRELQAKLLEVALEKTGVGETLYKILGGK